MSTINIEQLRGDLIDFLGTAYFTGGFGAAIFETYTIKDANEQELIYFARKYNSVSLFGRYLDAVVDKVFAFSLLLPIIINSHLNLHNYNLIFVNIFLELIIAILNIYAFFKNLEPTSTITGKIKTIFLFALLGVLYLNKLIDIKDIYIFILIIITMVLQILSIFSYYLKIKGRKVNLATLSS